MGTAKMVVEIYGFPFRFPIYMMIIPARHSDEFLLSINNFHIFIKHTGRIPDISGRLIVTGWWLVCLRGLGKDLYMLDVKLCPECNVPEPFCQGQVWLNNGDIVQSANPRTRLTLIECESLDPLFRNIGDIVGIPIEDMVANIAARGTKIYISDIIPREIKGMVRTKMMEPTYFIDNITSYCQIIGMGKYEWLGFRYENDADDYAKQRITDPYSVPLAAGGFAGAVSAVVGGEHAVTYREASPGVYELTTHWTEYPQVFKRKLLIHEYHHEDGDLELLKCATCGGPKALSEFKWHLDRGIIVNERTGRRMSLLGPEVLDPIFSALEGELGKEIPGVVIEAQRRFVRTGFFSLDITQAEEDLRDQLALRGLGNLREIRVGRKGAHMRLDNSCHHLLVAGLVQGNFEMAFDVLTKIDWGLSREGSLELRITPK
jgi:hypothetical protein